MRSPELARGETSSNHNGRAERAEMKSVEVELTRPHPSRQPPSPTHRRTCFGRAFAS